MSKDNSIGLLILLGIIAIALMGGSQGTGTTSFFSPSPQTPAQKQAYIAEELRRTELEVNELKAKVQAEEEKKTHSQYKERITVSYVNRSNDPTYEYVMIQHSSMATSSVKVTGWTLKSLNSGTSITIPQASYLYFAGGPNSEEDIYLAPGETLYLITGRSPNGASFKLNKCSGYLNQFQTFVPYLSTSCPSPRYEDLSSIPKSSVNDACLDYIGYFPSCRIQTDPLPTNWTYECTNFIYNKINYPSCVTTHKNDKDFYVPEWRVYLKRSERLWKDWREDIVLYDNIGKIVDTINY